MKEIITAALKFVKERQGRLFDGHDYYHTERVYKKTLYLAREEGANAFISGLAAILHDLDNKKVVGEERGDCVIAREFLMSQGMAVEDTNHVCDIINFVANRPNAKHMRRNKEAMVVADANMLDSIGAIGIARAFAYSAVHQQIMYDGNISNDNTIKYFYDALMSLPDLMYTDTARSLAEDRHEFMERFLQQFYYEWKV